MFDVTSGPVLVRRGAHVRAFTRLVGPCAVLENASVLGDRVSACSIGEGSVIRGEISETSCSAIRTRGTTDSSDIRIWGDGRTSVRERSRAI